MPSKATREWLYAELDDLVARVSEKQHRKFVSGDLDSAAWLACVEDVLIDFIESRLDDAIDAAEECRYDRVSARDAEEAFNGSDHLMHLQAEARGLK